MTFLITFLSVALIVGFLYVSAWSKKKRLSSTSWTDLVAKLEEVPMKGISRVALTYLKPKDGQRVIQADEMWLLVGGEVGLKRMKANAEILLQLAAFAEQWDQEESIVVGQQMRREALALRRAVRKILVGQWFESGSTKSTIFVQEAASSYFFIRQRILALYQTGHVGRYGRLSIALGDMMAAYGPAI